MALFVNGTQCALLSKTQSFDEVLVTFSTWDRKRKLSYSGGGGIESFLVGFLFVFFTKNIKGDKYVDKHLFG